MKHLTSLQKLYLTVIENLSVFLTVFLNQMIITVFPAYDSVKFNGTTEAVKLNSTMTEVNCLIRDTSNSYVAMLIGCKYCTELVMLPLVGIISDHYHPPLVLFVGLLAEMTACLIYAATGNFYVTLVGRVVDGIGNSLVSTAGLTIIYLIYLKDRARNRLITIDSILAYISAYLSPFAAGYIYDSLAGTNETLARLSTFMLLSPFFMILALLTVPFAFSQWRPFLTWLSVAKNGSPLTVTATFKNKKSIIDKSFIKTSLSPPCKDDQTIPKSPLTTYAPPIDDPLLPKAPYTIYPPINDKLPFIQTPITVCVSPVDQPTVLKAPLSLCVPLNGNLIDDPILTKVSLNVFAPIENDPIKIKAPLSICVLIRDGHIMLILVMLTSNSLVCNSLETTLPIYMNRRFCSDQRQQGIVWLFGMVSLGGFFLSTFLFHMRPSVCWLLPLIGLLLNGALCISVPFCQPWWTIGLVIGLMSFCSSVTDVILIPLVPKIIDERYSSSSYGSSSGLTLITFTISGLLGSFPVGPLVDHFGFMTLCAVLCASNICLAPFLIWLRYYF